jgi:hypothetical protein
MLSNFIDLRKLCCADGVRLDDGDTADGYNGKYNDVELVGDLKAKGGTSEMVCKVIDIAADAHAKSWDSRRCARAGNGDKRTLWSKFPDLDISAAVDI